MDDLTSKINEVLSDPQAMQQLNSLAASLGLGNSMPNTPTPPGQNAPANNNPLQGLDLSSLAGLLGNAGATPPGGGNIPQSPGAAGGLDTAKIATLLSSLGGANGLGALSGLLGGNNGGGLGALSGLLGGGGGGGGLDGDILQTVTKILPLLSAFRQEDNNTRLLHALRPLLGAERQKKADEAIKILSMLRLLPILRGQGIL
ncbi:MAG: hypothetical protein E7L17_12580 [Clostridium sp.]|uniref:hypothetical protein n=1 Tax=Clostridium sp. TaxID=1506 RepID=UPI00290B9EB0|nr:hypothetical protein [Clostridium sp.]MDU7338939.1 hypothetical protein [Clostridium sp.]